MMLRSPYYQSLIGKLDNKLDRWTASWTNRAIFWGLNRATILFYQGFEVSWTLSWTTSWTNAFCVRRFISLKLFVIKGLGQVGHCLEICLQTDQVGQAGSPLLTRLCNEFQVRNPNSLSLRERIRKGFSLKRREVPQITNEQNFL